MVSFFYKGNNYYRLDITGPGGKVYDAFTIDFKRLRAWQEQEVP